jgi:hypothetical protein
MPLWRIVARAAPEDPRWMGGPIWDEVIVRAPLASLARVAAAEMEANALGTRPGKADLKTTDFASSFFDEKLYHVERTSRQHGDEDETDVDCDAVEILSYQVRSLGTEL